MLLESRYRYLLRAVQGSLPTRSSTPAGRVPVTTQENWRITMASAPNVFAANTGSTQNPPSRRSAPLTVASTSHLAHVPVNTAVTTAVVTNTYLTTSPQMTSQTQMPRIAVSQGLNPLAPPYTLNNTFNGPSASVPWHEAPQTAHNYSAPVTSVDPATSINPAYWNNQTYNWNLEPNNQQAWLSRNLHGLPTIANSTRIDDDASDVSSQSEGVEELERRIERLKLETQRLEEQSRRAKEDILHNQRMAERMEIMRRNCAASMLPKAGTPAVPAFPQQMPMNSACAFPVPDFQGGGTQTYRLQGMRSLNRHSIACSSRISRKLYSSNSSRYK